MNSGHDAGTSTTEGDEYLAVSDVDVYFVPRNTIFSCHLIQHGSRWVVVKESVRSYLAEAGSRAHVD